MSAAASGAPRVAGERTARRLGWAALGYLALVVAIITLAPFRFRAAPVHGVSTLLDRQDVIMNVLMFVPLGFVYQLTRPRGAPARWGRIAALAAAASGAIELLQLFEAERFTSVVDLATNTAGALAGAWLHGRVARRLAGGAVGASAAALEVLALELPLTSLAYQLAPLCWLIGLGAAGDRRWLLLAPAAITGLVLGAIHAAYVAPAGGRDRRWLVGAALAWAAVAAVPAARGAPALVVAAAVVTVGVALLRAAAPAPTAAFGRRQRFEAATLRVAVPLFVAYAAASALWPPGAHAAPDAHAAARAWQGSWAMATDGAALTQVAVYRLLERVAAATVLGYMLAEQRGRADEGLRQAAPRLLAIGGAASAALEVARGFWSPAGASAATLLLTLVATLFGGGLYQLQRAHVQALVAARRARAGLG